MMTQPNPRHEAEEVGRGQTLGRPCQSLAPVPLPPALSSLAPA